VQNAAEGTALCQNEYDFLGTDFKEKYFIDGEFGISDLKAYLLSTNRQAPAWEAGEKLGTGGFPQPSPLLNTPLWRLLRSFPGSLTAMKYNSSCACLETTSAVTPTYPFTQTNTHARTHTRTRAHAHTRMHIHTHTGTSTHTNTHTHKHTSECSILVE
jgi:hypothetical protein